jgi:cysteine desulfurase
MRTVKPIYLDHAATTPTDPAVVQAMLPFFTEIYGNPSSMHAFGQEAKRAIEAVRERIAAFLGADPDEIIFTSGGTESNNFIIKGTACAAVKRGNHVITSSIEHHAVLESCRYLEKQGFEITYLDVDRFGRVAPDVVKKAMTKNTILISVMHANNEIGTLEPISEIGRIARENGIPFHTDAVQTFGHLPINVNDLNIDALSASAHKLYGPKGVGVLYLRKGTRIEPFLHGGEQEKRRRASTHNVAGIVGFGKAVELASARMGEEENIEILRDKLAKGILERIEDARFNGHPVYRLPNNVNVSIAGVESEALVLNLDMEGIAVSTGSACTSASLEASHVLTAIGLPRERAQGSLRLTLGRSTTGADIDHVLALLPEMVHKLRAISPHYRKQKICGG